MKLTEEQKDLFVGTLLGDGSLQTETDGRTWRYRALHKAKDVDYLQHKYELLKDLCASPPVFNQVTDARTGRAYQRWCFQTTVQPSFRYYGNLFYKKDSRSQRMVKDVPLTIQQLLTPRSVAYWYMDDGSLKWFGRSNAMRICTESFSKEGVERLQATLKNLYGIDTQLTRKNSDGRLVGYRLAINEENATAFRELIRPYLVAPMGYKVSDGNRGHL